MRLHTVAALCLAAAAPGCAFLKPARSQDSYYLLTPTPPTATTAYTSHPIPQSFLRLRSIELADYLNTQEIAVRHGTNQVQFDLFHCWAEPLDAGIRRVLVADLRTAPAIGVVLTDESAPRRGRVCTLSVRVLACEGRVFNHQASAAFEADWQITGPDPADAVLAHGVFRASPAAWKEGDYSSLAAQLSRALGEFTQVLTNALSQTPTTAQSRLTGSHAPPWQGQIH